MRHFDYLSPYCRLSFVHNTVKEASLKVDGGINYFENWVKRLMRCYSYVNMEISSE